MTENKFNINVISYLIVKMDYYYKKCIKFDLLFLVYL